MSFSCCHHSVISVTVYAWISFLHANASLLHIIRVEWEHMISRLRCGCGPGHVWEKKQKKKRSRSMRSHATYTPRSLPTCESPSSLKGWMSFITRITFTPSDIVFSNCVDLFTFKGQPLAWLNSTWQRIVRRGQPNTCITPASKSSKLIFPINGERVLMLMKADN